VEASSSFPLALRLSLLAAALLAALVWILRLLARRLIRVLAGLVALSILLTILVGIILFVITHLSPVINGRGHMATEHTVVRSGKLKRKPFNSNVADYLLIIATSKAPEFSKSLSAIWSRWGTANVARASRNWRLIPLAETPPKVSLKLD
jgi:hypothetical protein